MNSLLSLSGRNPAAPVFYGIMFLLSAAVLIYYIARSKRKYLWILLLFISVFIVNTGYLAFSLSTDLSEALLANRIAYFGNVYMLLLLLLTIWNACGIEYRKSYVIILASVSTVMFLLSCTQGYLDIFYRNASFSIENGFPKIIKDYGPMHTAYIVYIYLYFSGIVITLLYSWRKKKNRDFKYIAVIAGVGLVNVAIWFIEQLVDNNIEYLAFSYIVNEIILLWVYSRLVSDGVLNTYMIRLTFRPEDSDEKTIDIMMSDEDENRILTGNENHKVNLSGLPDEKLMEIINRVENSEKLTEREKEVAVLLLKDLKRKEMAENLFISEDTVKTHTSHVFGKLEVSSRKELQELARKKVD